MIIYVSPSPFTQSLVLAVYNTLPLVWLYMYSRIIEHRASDKKSQTGASSNGLKSNAMKKTIQSQARPESAEK